MLAVLSNQNTDRPVEHLALVGDRRGVDGVVGRDAVAGDHQQPRGAVLAGLERVHLADLAAGDQGQVGESAHVGDATSAPGRRDGSVRRSRRAGRRSRRDVPEVVVGVEDRVEVEALGALVGLQQTPQRDALVPGPLGAAPGRSGRPRRGSMPARPAPAARAGRTARRGSARGSRASARRRRRCPRRGAIARCCR